MGRASRSIGERHGVLKGRSSALPRKSVCLIWDATLCNVSEEQSLGPLSRYLKARFEGPSQQQKVVEYYCVLDKEEKSQTIEALKAEKVTVLINEAHGDADKSGKLNKVVSDFLVKEGLGSKQLVILSSVLACLPLVLKAMEGGIQVTLVNSTDDEQGSAALAQGVTKISWTSVLKEYEDSTPLEAGQSSSNLTLDKNKKTKPGMALGGKRGKTLKETSQLSRKAAATSKPEVVKGEPGSEHEVSGEDEPHGGPDETAGHTLEKEPEAEVEPEADKEREADKELEAQVEPEADQEASRSHVVNGEDEACCSEEVSKEDEQESESEATAEAPLADLVSEVEVPEVEGEEVKALSEEDSAPAGPEETPVETTELQDAGTRELQEALLVEVAQLEPDSAVDVVKLLLLRHDESTLRSSLEDRRELRTRVNEAMCVLRPYKLIEAMFATNSHPGSPHAAQTLARFNAPDTPRSPGEQADQPSSPRTPNFKDAPLAPTSQVSRLRGLFDAQCCHSPPRIKDVTGVPSGQEAPPTKPRPVDPPEPLIERFPTEYRPHVSAQLLNKVQSQTRSLVNEYVRRLSAIHECVRVQLAADSKKCRQHLWEVFERTAKDELMHPSDPSTSGQSRYDEEDQISLLHFYADLPLEDSDNELDDDKEDPAAVKAREDPPSSSNVQKTARHKSIPLLSPEDDLKPKVAENKAVQEVSMLALVVPCALEAQRHVVQKKAAFRDLLEELGHAKVTLVTTSAGFTLDGSAEKVTEYAKKLKEVVVEVEAALVKVEVQVPANCLQVLNPPSSGQLCPSLMDLVNSEEHPVWIECVEKETKVPAEIQPSHPDPAGPTSEPAGSQGKKGKKNKWWKMLGCITRSKNEGESKSPSLTSTGTQFPDAPPTPEPEPEPGMVQIWGSAEDAEAAVGAVLKLVAAIKGEGAAKC